MEIKEKRKELLHMSDRDLINRILAFPDRERLNRDEDGKRRKYPSAEMAVRTKKLIENNPEYKISDKQRYVMADSFATYSTDELKVVGIKFVKADPRLMDKTQISQEGQKAVYAMKFHLVPEPENEHDKNAVAVYVDDADHKSKTRIGYVPGAYVAEHPITQEMSVEGTLTDHSNGHFKTISYTMNLDTEMINNLSSPNRNPESYTYQMPFILNGPVKEGAAEYLNDQRDWTKWLNNELEYWGINGQAENVAFSFPGNRSGMVTVESKSALNTEAMQVCGSYFRYSLESGISGDLKRDNYVDVPLNLPAVNTRERTYFSLQAEPQQSADADFAAAIDSMEETGKGLEQ